MNALMRLVGVLVMVAAMTGCATSGNPRDPYENFNRAMFSFNDKLDQAALKPAATVYKSVLPSFVQTGVGNFFGNIGDVWTTVNSFLQGNITNGLSDFMRVAVNTTLGLGGVLDIGSEAGMTKHKEDFGQTLAVWGVKSGPYVVLPFLGSSTMRDTLATPVDIAGDLWLYKTPVKVRNAGSVVRVVDQRAAVLDASNLIEDAAIDKYEFVRDAYLQRRANSINNGNNPKRSADVDEDDVGPTPTAAVPSVEPGAKSGIQNPKGIDEAKKEAPPVKQGTDKPPANIEPATKPTTKPALSGASTSSDTPAKQLITKAE